VAGERVQGILDVARRRVADDRDDVAGGADLGDVDTAIETCGFDAEIEAAAV